MISIAITSPPERTGLDWIGMPPASLARATRRCEVGFESTLVGAAVGILVPLWLTAAQAQNAAEAAAVEALKLNDRTASGSCCGSCRNCLPSSSLR
jgi:hypothetical protein